MEAEQLEEMARDEAVLTPDLAAKNISKHYIQDLFLSLNCIRSVPILATFCYRTRDDINHFCSIRLLRVI
jgi:hypothetical protein